MKTRKYGLILLPLLVLVFIHTASAQNYQDIRDPNNPQGVNAASGISRTGEIVGSYRDINFVARGFLLLGTQFTDINDPNTTTYTAAEGINSEGAIVGTYIDASGNSRGFLRDPRGNYRDVGPPGAIAAGGINDNGVMVGTYLDSSGKAHAWVGKNGKYRKMDVFSSKYKCNNKPCQTWGTGINNKGWITAYILDVDNLNEGFFYAGQWKKVNYRGGYQSLAYGINDSGDVVLTWCENNTSRCDSGANLPHGALYRGGRFTRFDDPNGTQTYGLGINNSRTIVGYYNFNPTSVGFQVTGVR